MSIEKRPACQNFTGCPLLDTKPKTAGVTTIIGSDTRKILAGYFFYVLISNLRLSHHQQVSKYNFRAV